jgi:DNA-binding MarR family transcriptional regulator
MKESNEKLLSALFNIGRQIREEIQGSNCLDGFTQSQMQILGIVSGKKGTTMRSIADYMHVKPSSATPLINNLVKKGSLKRVPDKKDRRVIFVEITPKGALFLKNKYKSVHKTIGKIFGKLSGTDKNNLIKILEKIHAE